MRTSYPVVFTSLALLTVRLSFTKAFTVNVLPATVTAGQVEILTWSREQNDPTSIQLAKSSAGSIPLGPIDPIVSVRKEETQGTLRVTFINVEQVTIVAYDLNHVSYDLLVEADKKKPPPFFSDPAHPIVIKSTVSQAPPQSPQQTAAHAPTTTPSNPPVTTASTSQTNGTPIVNPSQVPTSSATSGVNSSSMTGPSGAVPTKESTGADTASQHGSSGSPSEMQGNGNLHMTPSGTESNTYPTAPAWPGGPTTTNSSTSSPPHPSNLGIIVGAILGSLAFIVFIILLVVCILRRGQKIRSLPTGPGRFYRDKMIKSDEHIPGEPAHSDMEPLTTSTCDSPNHSDDGEPITHFQTTTLQNRSSNTTMSTIHVPDYRTIYTIMETDSAYESYESSDFTSTVEHAEPYYGVAPRTDRQMSIEKKILQLQGKLLRLHIESRSTGSIPSVPSIVGDIKERIERLKVLQEGEWAREMVDDVPIEMSPQSD